VLKWVYFLLGSLIKGLKYCYIMLLDVLHMEEMRNPYNISVGKLEGKRPFGRPRCRWEDLRMDLREIS